VRVVLWLFRAVFSDIAVTIAFVLLAPVQLICWLRRRTPFFETEPYQWLIYCFVKGTALPGGGPPPYAEWLSRRRGDR
jgi:hypothetical protein